MSVDLVAGESLPESESLSIFEFLANGDHFIVTIPSAHGLNGMLLVESADYPGVRPEAIPFRWHSGWDIVLGLRAVNKLWEMAFKAYGHCSVELLAAVDHEGHPFATTWEEFESHCQTNVSHTRLNYLLYRFRCAPPPPTPTHMGVAEEE